MQRNGLNGCASALDEKMLLTAYIEGCRPVLVGSRADRPGMANNARANMSNH
jgi:hypothetical protein